MLEQCHVPDLLVKNYGDNESGYGVSIVIRVVESYVSFVSNKPTPKIFSFGRFIDAYLRLVARNENLSAKSFQSLQSNAKKMLGIVITTSIEPLTYTSC
jgi:hypothetical protein